LILIFMTTLTLSDMTEKILRNRKISFLESYCGDRAQNSEN